MRWFIVLLLLANLGLFFWLQHDSLPDAPVAALPPPDIGRLQLLNEKPTPPQTTQHATRLAGNGLLDVAKPRTNEVDAGLPAKTIAELSAPQRAAPQSAGQQPVASAVTTEEPVRADALSESPVLPPSVAPASAEAEPGADAVATKNDDEGSASTTMAEVGSPTQDTIATPDAEAIAAAPGVVSADETAVADTEPSCALIGPMPSEAADALIRQLPAFVTLLSEMTVEVGEVDGYYVMIPPLPSRAAGRAMLERLQAAGITDNWLFQRGDNRNAISLGLFSRKAGAERHLRRVNQRGFEAMLMEKTTPEEHRQLLVKNVDGGDVALSLPLPDDVLAEQRPCP